MKNPGIIYWKWDDSHLKTGKYLEEAHDLIRRSCYDHIYITTHWCHEGITSPDLFDAIKKTTGLIHSCNRKIIFEIDFRAEKQIFVKKHPNRRTGFIYWKEADLDQNGCGTASYLISAGNGGELFLGNTQSGEELLKIYSYQKTARGYEPDTLRDITGEGTLCRRDPNCVDVTISAPSSHGQKVFVMVVSWFDFNDLFSQENDSFFLDLLEQYSAIPLDGIALDEMGYPWHVDFNFTPSTYLTWNNSPYFTWEMARKYEEKYGRDYLLDCLNRFIGYDRDEREQIKSINYYFEFIRKEIVRVETFFYTQVKKLYGEKAFVGVHPTWYAIEEVQNTPEVWKNGIDWWEVPRDYGFTDEIMLYPVRLSLTHKANASVFYNMWYTEATLCTNSFFTEIYRNIRYGGRTIALSYECINENQTVAQLVNPGELERVSEAEKIAELADWFQSSPAASDLLVIMGIPAACSILDNLDGKDSWNHYRDRFKDCFEVARDIWNSGYNCDLVGSYEIDNGNVCIDNTGNIVYGNQVFRYVVICYPDFCKKEMITFIKTAKAAGAGITLIGAMNRDFDGENVQKEFSRLMQGVSFFDDKPESSDLLSLFHKSQIQTHRIMNGCLFQDGSAHLTAPSPVKPSGNYFESEFVLSGHSVLVRANDYVGIKLNQAGDVEKLAASGLYELQINSEPVYVFNQPEELRIV